MMMQNSQMSFSSPGHKAQQRVLGLLGLAWRERWTGIMRVQARGRQLCVALRDGGPVARSDLGILEAFPDCLAVFEFCSQRRNGARKALGKRLVPEALKRPYQVPWPWVRLLLNEEEAIDLELPEVLLQLSRHRDARLPLAELEDSLGGREFIGALARLGFVEESNLASTQRLPGDDASSLLAGLSALEQLLPEALLAELPDTPDPQQQLLERVRGRAIGGNWDAVHSCFEDYVGPIDSAELAAWRALAVIRAKGLKGPRRLSQAVRWSQLARKLTPSRASQRVLRQVQVELRALLDGAPSGDRLA